MCRFLLTIFVFLVTLGSALAEVSRDISYGSIEKQALDIYAPENMKNVPVMVYVHGGAWAIGDKSRVHSKARAFNDAGYVFVSVGYPLLPDHAVEVQAQSVADAVAWVVKNIDQYGGDAKRIHIMGHSAGAHLVGLVATDENYLEKAGAGLSVIQSVTSVDTTALDVKKRMQNLGRKRQSKRIFENAFGRDPARWVTLSPIEHIEGGKGIPPFLILTGDRIIVENVARDFAARLEKAGSAAKIVAFPDKSHREINIEIGAKNDDPIFQVIMDFIE